MCTHQNLSIKPAIFEKKINHAFILDPQNIKQIITTETHKRTLTKKKKKKKDQMWESCDNAEGTQNEPSPVLCVSVVGPEPLDLDKPP